MRNSTDYWHLASVPQWLEQQLRLVLHASPTALQLEYTHVLDKHSALQQSALIEQSPPTAVHALAQTKLTQLLLQQPAGLVQASPSWPLSKHAYKVTGSFRAHKLLTHAPQQGLVPQSVQVSHTLVVLLHCRPAAQVWVNEQLCPFVRINWQVPAPSQYCPEQQGKSPSQLSPVLRQGGGPQVPARQVFALHSAGPVQLVPLASGALITHWSLTHTAPASASQQEFVQPVTPSLRQFVLVAPPEFAPAAPLEPPFPVPPT